jgi:large subunit ribosomal protein L24
MAHNPKEKKPLHLAKLHVHTGDTVRVIAGKDRDRTKDRKVVRAMPREGKVIVEGVNIAKKHVKRGRAGMQPGIIEKAMPLNASNVMVVCTECGQPTRIAHDRVPVGTDQKERTRRVCKKCGKAIQEHTRG